MVQLGSVQHGVGDKLGRRFGTQQVGVDDEVVDLRVVDVGPEILLQIARATEIGLLNVSECGFRRHAAIFREPADAGFQGADKPDMQHPGQSSRHHVPTPADDDHIAKGAEFDGNDYLFIHCVVSYLLSRLLVGGDEFF